MLDTHTLLVTQDRPSGPLLVIEDVSAVEDREAPLSLGLIIGQLIGLAVIVGLGAYFALGI